MRLLGLVVAIVASVGWANAGTEVTLDVKEGTWISVDSSPSDEKLVFDLLGKLFTVDAAGGAATPLLIDDAFDSHPVYSPDGKRVAFISDRNGSENLWVADADGAHPVKLSNDTEGVFVGPAWSADSSAVYVTRINNRNRRNTNITGALWNYSLAGVGEALNVGAPHALSEIHGAAPSRDGRSLYFSARPAGEAYSIYRHDFLSGVSNIVLSGVERGAGVMQPILSPDGSQLAYAVDAEGGTELRVRSLATGNDRRLAHPIEMAMGRSQHAYQGLLPHFAVTADSKAIVIGYGGKLHRIDIASGEARIIPFTARPVIQQRQISKREHRVDETGPVRARVIQWAQLSPDGKQLAFSAFGKLHVSTLGSDRSSRITQTAFSAEDVSESYPSWSPDGRWLVYATWSGKEGGHLWRVRLAGGKPQRLTEFPAFYSRPTFTPDGRSILALRAAASDTTEQRRMAAKDVIRIPVTGGAATLLTQIPGGGSTSPAAFEPGRLHFNSAGTTVFVHASQGLMQFPLAGDEAKLAWHITAPKPSAFLPEVDDAAISADGQWALVQHNFQLHLLHLPAKASSGGALDISAAGSSVYPLTEVGADEFAWSADGRSVTWSVGSSVYTASLTDILKRRTAIHDGCVEAPWKRWDITATMPRDTPQREFVLQGATVATMNGSERMARADVVVANNRLKSVAPVETQPLPPQALRIDVSGKTITPGFVDTHAHYSNTAKRSIEYGSWELPMALAYGVTTSLDPQSGTPDLFVFQDLIDAGMTKGPRAYTTGPGIFQWSDIDSVRKTSCILSRYRDHYRTGAVKSYLIGSRQQRQYMAEAAEKMGLMTVTENWGTPRYALSQAMDGFSTNEHASDAVDYYDDVVQLYSRTGVGYSPTTLIGGESGLEGLQYFLSRRDILADQKVNRFMPRNDVIERLRNVTWAPRDAFIFDRLAASAAKIFRAGGNVGLGSHGELQGLGYHWELEALASGGMTPHEVLQIATRSSAAVIGRSADVGTLEPGKYADLLIFDRSPIDDLKNLDTLRYVIKNGRIYAAESLIELSPEEIR